MLPGPVFSLEIVTSSRRARNFVVRTGFGLILLALIAISYNDMVRVAPDQAVVVSGRRLASFARETFDVLAVAQLVAVVTLTPALFAGAIAEEKQRGTLLYLMGTSLSSAEIIVGKLAARGLHMLVAIAVAFPILSFLTLLGGVPPVLVLGIELISVSTTLLLAALSILVSVYSRRVGEALLVVYLIEFVWLPVLPLLAPLIRWYLPAEQGWIAAPLDWLLASNPFVAWWGAASSAGSRAILEVVGWIAAAHGILAIALLAIAVARLRPVFRTESAVRPTGIPRGQASRRDHWHDTQVLDRYPMIWKEARRPHRGRIARIGWRVSGVLILLLLSYWGIRLGVPAARELFRNGYGSGQPDREAYNAYVRACAGLLSLVWVLGLAATSASCITTEKEGETWLSLRATLLRPSEILAGKLLGSLWRLRLVGGCMLFLWASGLLLGAVHPLGFLAVVIAWVVYSAFLAALGTFVSLRSRTTLRATTLTLALVVIFNVGYMLVCLFNWVDFPLLGVGCTPLMLSLAPMSYSEVGSLVRGGWMTGLVFTDEFITFALSVAGYGLGATLLMLGSFLLLDGGSHGSPAHESHGRRQLPGSAPAPTEAADG